MTKKILFLCSLTIFLSNHLQAKPKKKDSVETKKQEAASQENIDIIKLDAGKIMEEAENIRNPQGNYQTNVEIIDQEGDKSKDVRTYETIVKGRDKTLVKFLTPATDADKRLLMLDNDMWFYTRSAAKPIRIAPRQKLSGNAAYGDVTRLNFTGNYEAKILKIEELNKEKILVLDLTAITGRPVTYDKVEYWVQHKDHKPIKALYLTRSGKVIREGFFENFTDVLGIQRPASFRLVNYLNKNHTTTLNYTNTKKGDFPDALFLKENLSRN